MQQDDHTLNSVYVTSHIWSVLDIRKIQTQILHFPHIDGSIKCANRFYIKRNMLFEWIAPSLHVVFFSNSFFLTSTCLKSMWINARIHIHPHTQWGCWIVVAAEAEKTNGSSSQRSNVKQVRGMFTVKLYLNSVRARAHEHGWTHRDISLHATYSVCLYSCVLWMCVYTGAFQI